jgi:hypothetical protein
MFGPTRPGHILFEAAKDGTVLDEARSRKAAICFCPDRENNVSFQGATTTTTCHASGKKPAAFLPPKNVVGR